MTASQPSQDQLHLANILGLDISADTFDVAAARLLDLVAVAIGYEPADSSSERQRAFAESLGQDVESDSKRVASAKIGEALLAKNRGAIESLNLRPGDRVIRTTQFEHAGELRSFEQEFIVS
ncbi:hypothetical protein I5L51_20910 [Pseudomonas mendocina]|nr:hypothetical protein [Pseudomonas mendocina]MBH3341575.1 hypothetical protein [Pseudomonas mendocina]